MDVIIRRQMVVGGVHIGGHHFYTKCQKDVIVLCDKKKSRILYHPNLSTFLSFFIWTTLNHVNILY